MASFILKNTLSDFGAVNRGVCEVKDSMLTDVVETYNTAVRMTARSIQARKKQPSLTRTAMCQ